MNVKEKLTDMLKKNGASLVGYSDISCVAEEKRKGLSYAVTIACALDKDVVKSIQGAPTNFYYEEYKRKNILLNELGKKCAEFLIQAGYNAEPLPTTEVAINKNLETDFPHKTGAVLSGLGWIGRCALLITPNFGSAVRLTSVFTDLPADSSEVMSSRCGKCNECVINCPGNAVKGETWNQGLERNDIYDAFACRKTASELSAKIGVNNTICGVCIASCPWTKKYINSIS